ncbi:hypothetical protein ACFRCI_43910 [Streptomyces sp. NPDC056638]|uniref:hypothetical protein n=1 Tax=Streptomyces sp. NPDC056638 TaxID=3345887 RepID=UPI00367D5006
MVERQKRKRDEMAQKGQHFGGHRSFAWETDGMTPVDHEFEHIQEAAHVALAGASPRSLAAGWMAHGVKTTSANVDPLNRDPLGKESPSAPTLPATGA